MPGAWSSWVGVAWVRAPATTRAAARAGLGSVRACARHGGRGPEPAEACGGGGRRDTETPRHRAAGHRAPGRGTRSCRTPGRTGTPSRQHGGGRHLWSVQPPLAPGGTCGPCAAVRDAGLRALALGRPGRPRVAGGRGLGRPRGRPGGCAPVRRFVRLGRLLLSLKVVVKRPGLPEVVGEALVHLLVFCFRTGTGGELLPTGRQVQTQRDGGLPRGPEPRPAPWMVGAGPAALRWPPVTGS